MLVKAGISELKQDPPKGDLVLFPRRRSDSSRRDFLKETTAGVAVIGGVMGSALDSVANEKDGAVVAISDFLLPQAQKGNRGSEIAKLKERKKTLEQQAGEARKGAAVVTATLIGSAGAVQYLADRNDAAKERTGQGRG